MWHDVPTPGKTRKSSTRGLPETNPKLLGLSNKKGLFLGNKAPKAAGDKTRAFRRQIFVGGRFEKQRPTEAAGDTFRAFGLPQIQQKDKVWEVGNSIKNGYKRQDN